MVITFIYCNRPIDSLRVQVRCRNLADAINRAGQHRANLLDMKSFVENTSRAQRLCGESDLLIIIAIYTIQFFPSFSIGRRATKR